MYTDLLPYSSLADDGQHQLVYCQHCRQRIMKIHLPTHHFKNSTHRCFKNIDNNNADKKFQETYSTKGKVKKGRVFQKCDTPFFVDFKEPEKNYSSNTRVPKTPKRISSSFFKKPLEFPVTPNVNLINLSFSQPSTPKTPYQRLMMCATPYLFRSQNSRNCDFNRNIPFTPLLEEAMKLMDETNHTEPCSDIPDILQLIDDDSKPVDLVDKQISINSDVNLCDNTVVDYLLDLSNDYTGYNAPKTVKKLESREKPYPIKETMEKKRKCRRAKPVLFEESLVYHEQKKQREKERRQKRKERFQQKSSKGTRKSMRRKKRVYYY